MDAPPADLVPLDVLAHLLSYLPHHHRLLICSLVCKRWHAAVLRSVTWLRIPDNATDEVAQRLLERHPALTHLRVSRSWPGVLPPRIARLTVSHVDRSHTMVMSSSVTHLDLRGSFIDGEDLVDVLLPCVTSLVHLSLPVTALTSIELAGQLASRLHSLTSLSLHYGSYELASTECCLAGCFLLSELTSASQLCSLSLVGSPIVFHFTNLFPRLTRLDVKDFHPDRPSDSVLERAPNLRKLYASSLAAIPVFPRQLTDVFVINSVITGRPPGVRVHTIMSALPLYNYVDIIDTDAAEFWSVSFGEETKTKEVPVTAFMDAFTYYFGLTHWARLPQNRIMLRCLAALVSMQSQSQSYVNAI